MKNSYENNIEITLNPFIYYYYWFFIGISAIFGQISKIIFKSNWKKFGKKSLITGIPFLRTQFFVFPVILNLIFFIWLIFIFKTNINLNNKYFTLKNFLIKIRFGFLFSNILIFCLFFLIYNFVITPAFKKYHFRVSGHITCAIFSGALLNHLDLLCNNLYEFNRNINNYLILVIKFLLWHNVYSLFWSAYLFHTIIEILIGYVISICFILFVHFINFDNLVYQLLFESNDEFNKFDKNIIYISNMRSNIINKKNI